MFLIGNEINKGRKHSSECIAKRLATIKERDPEGKRYEKAKRTRAINLASGKVVQAPSWCKGKKRPPEFGAIIKKKAIERHFTNGMRHEICRMYIEEGMTARQIGEKIGTSKDVITKRLKEEGIKIKGVSGFLKGKPFTDNHRMKLSVGIRNSSKTNWNGGTSFEPYSPVFTKILREKIKQRDGYSCRLCTTENGLLVHHIDYNKKNSDTLNLVTLCRSCHAKTNVKRAGWTEFFKELMKERMIVNA